MPTFVQMKAHFFLWPGLIAFPLVLATCGASTSAETPPVPAAPSRDFDRYWYKGKAEVNRYELSQARYGELRAGHALMVFVTEDFLLKEHVKYEGIGDGARTSVLKLNWIERFNTGIYDYSLMTSVFSPVDGTPALKHTLSVQDWCGQVWAQTDRRADGYTVEQRSYFQQEGDATVKVGDVWLEDAVWNQLRIDPKRAPVGKLRMLPSQRYLRLAHKPIEAVDATAAMTAGADTTRYVLAFPSMERTVEIRFATAFPHTIFGWSETRMDGWGSQAKVLTTEARLTHQVMEPYWEQHGNADNPMRERLGLPPMPGR